MIGCFVSFVRVGFVSLGKLFVWCFFFEVDECFFWGLWVRRVYEGRFVAAVEVGLGFIFVGFFVVRLVCSFF